MNRQNDGNILPAKNLQKCFDDIENAWPKIFSAMAGHQDNPPVSLSSSYALPAGRQMRVGIDDGLGRKQRIHDCISGNVDPVPRHIFALERPRRPFSRSKMLVGDCADDFAGNLLWPWGIYIPAPQASFDMGHRNAAVVAGESSCHRSRGIALHDDSARADLIEDAADAFQQSA